MAATCNWTGQSGAVYSYTIYPMDTQWNDVAGNYIFCKETSPSTWSAIYVGQTDSFKNRLPNHEKLPAAKRLGATHIHAHVNTDEKARLKEEQDLIAACKPPCNET
jgi:hypothetical protein